MSRKLEFNMRIPLVLNAVTIAELNTTESREIQERRDQARAVGLFGELNNVVRDLVDMHDKENSFISVMLNRRFISTGTHRKETVLNLLDSLIRETTSNMKRKA
eukprot:scaffold87461_cov23-Cyclotella_meneghiniana.AAC.1